MAFVDVGGMRLTGSEKTFRETTPQNVKHTGQGHVPATQLPRGKGLPGTHSFEGEGLPKGEGPRRPQGKVGPPPWSPRPREPLKLAAKGTTP